MLGPMKSYHKFLIVVLLFSCIAWHINAKAIEKATKNEVAEMKLQDNLEEMKNVQLMGELNDDATTAAAAGAAGATTKGAKAGAESVITAAKHSSFYLLLGIAVYNLFSHF